MLIGVLAGYAITALWVQVSLGALPIDGNISITEAFQNNLPSTVPLSQIIGSPAFITFSLLFALLAIITSYLTNGYGLMEFIDDFLTNYFKKSNRLLIVLLSFGPPLIVTLIFPKIFLTALDMVGALGIAVLFGILPSIIAVLRARSSGKKSFLGLITFLIFMIVILFKIGKETGVINIKPGVRYVKYNFTCYVSRSSKADSSQIPDM